MTARVCPRRSAVHLLLSLLLVLVPRPGEGQAGALAGRCAAAGLAGRIDAIIDRAPLARAAWGIEVWDPRRGCVLYARNPQRHFVPASNLKLVVAATAAHLLPAGFRYRTVLYGTGPLEGAELLGGLVLRGNGDPTLSARYAPAATAVWEAFADSLAARGVRRVRGGLLADQSAWDTVRVRGDWEAYDLRWWYAAPVGPLGFNDNSIDFHIAPGGSVGSPARITAVPASGFYRFENRTRTVAAGRPTTLDLARVPGTNRIYAYGDIARGAAPHTEYFAVRDPGAYAATTLREVLAGRGIRFGEPGVRTLSDSAGVPAPQGPVRIEHASPPLPDIVGPILQNSQNWFAEQLLKTLGKELRGEGSWEAGLAVEREFLIRQVGIDSAAFVLRDGSGLSSGNLITPHALVQLLVFLRASPRGEMVRRALPVSGESGSNRGRLLDLRGRVAAKTGYINNVDALSGYVTADDGRELVFSIVANNSGLPSAKMKAAIDDVVRVLAHSGGP